MPLSRRELPEVGEYVIVSVQQVFEYGAYVSLEEYGGKRAFLPWSEVSTKWVKDIREVVREGQRAVARVIRVDRRKGEVDVSLKRVPDNERRRKMMWWKRYLKGCKVVEEVAQKLGKSPEQAYSEVIWKLEDAYGEPLTALEESVLRGPAALKEAGVPDEWIGPLIEEAKRHVSVRMVKLRIFVMARTLEKGGVLKIKELLNLEGEGVRVYVASAPRYVVEVEAPDYQTAEANMKKIEEELRSRASKLGLQITLERAQT
ncbi:MAG: translation initiation factor IF-2 subunit alpha [Desulfurococcaceae archaeon]